MFKRVHRPIHFDRLLCNFNRDVLKNEGYYIPKKNERLIGYKSHYSLNTKTIRKGLFLP